MDISPTRLQERYREGSVRPSEVMQAVLSRLHDEDQSGVWISTVDPEAAIRAARALDKQADKKDTLPLYGLIFSVKDCIDVAGVPTTAACPEFAYVPNRSSPVVERALAAGALYIGKTNLDQFATGLVGVRSPYGVARNPHNPDYVPGGSSSGSAVSVATRTSSFSLGTDTGGSGRVPASYCGVTGLKPAPGALSRRGMVHACRSFDTISIFTATPLDALTALAPLASFDRKDCFSIEGYRIDAVSLSASRCHSLRVAIPAEDQLAFFGNTETPVLFQQAIDAAPCLFGTVAQCDFSPFLAINDLMFFGPFVAERDVSVGEFLRDNPGAGHPIVRDIILGSTGFSAADAYRAQYQLFETRRQLEDFWRRHDVLMVPTVGTVLTLEDVARDPLTPNFNNGYYTNFANPLGLAAITVPTGRTEAGVPHSVTFYAPAGAETMLARLGTEFMAACEATSSALSLRRTPPTADRNHRSNETNQGVST